MVLIGKRYKREHEGKEGSGQHGAVGVVHSQAIGQPEESDQGDGSTVRAVCSGSHGRGAYLAGGCALYWPIKPIRPLIVTLSALAETWARRVSGGVRYRHWHIP